MFIDINELERHPLDFDQAFPPQVIDLGPDMVQRSPVIAKGRAQLLQERHSKHESLLDIRLNGQLSTSLEVLCARCLEAVPVNVARDFDLLYRPQGSDAGRQELSVTAVEAEISYYTGDGVLLEDVLREQILLAVPLKFVCREDCKGLCPVCGTNLNQGMCDCTRPAGDPRWAALKDLRAKLDR
jgi:DUF177 domain-containing protein